MKEPNQTITKDQVAQRHGLRIYLAVAAGITSLLSTYYLAKAKAFAFVDIGCDTFYCFYPLQVAISKQLHHLQSITWSFDLGLGGFMGSLIDPMWLITGWLPESWQLSLRLPMFVLRLLLGGGFIYGFLRLLRFDAALCVLGGLCYSFCAYATINAQWEVLHGTEYVQFAIYLYCLERYLQTGSRWPAVACGFVVGIGHPLGLYMFALLGAVYAVGKLSGLPRAQWIRFIGTMCKFAGWCVLGVALTAPLLFPEIYYLFESPRVSGDYAHFSTLLAAIFSLNDPVAFASEMAGLLGKDLLGTGSSYRGWGNYFEAPGFYIGLLPLLCIVQLLGPAANRNERVACIAAIVLTACYFVFPAVRYAVYAFGHFTFRFSTLWISFLLLVLGLCGLRRALVAGVWRSGVLIGALGILSIAVVAVIFIPVFVNMEHVLRVAAFVGLYSAILLFMPRGAERVAQSLQILVAVSACELLLFAIPPVIQRDAVGTDGTSSVGRYDDGSQQALAFIRAQDPTRAFYRVEKTFDSVFLDDALVQGYPGTKSYYFHASSITRFVDHLGLPRLQPSPNYINSMASRRNTLNLVGVKYLLARNRSLDAATDMTHIGAVGGIDIYRNEAALPFAQLVDSVSAESAIDKLPVASRDEALLRTVAVQDPQQVKATLAAIERADAPLSDLAPAAAMIKQSDISLAGTVQTPNARLLRLTMPFDRGWTARLDGKELQLFRADFGLTAALIAPGTHQLALDYAPPGRDFGKWFALASLLILISLGAADFRSRAHALSLRPSRRPNEQ